MNRIETLWAWLPDLALCPMVRSADAVVLAAQADKPGAGIDPTTWGGFFEDINFAADGGQLRTDNRELTTGGAQ